VETLTDFLKNCSLLDLFVILVTVILFLAGLVVLVVARSRKSMYRLLVVALVPFVLGVLCI
jgi:hypothetical protein